MKVRVSSLKKLTQKAPPAPSKSLIHKLTLTPIDCFLAISQLGLKVFDGRRVLLGRVLSSPINQVLLHHAINYTFMHPPQFNFNFLFLFLTLPTNNILFV